MYTVHCISVCMEITSEVHSSDFSIGSRHSLLFNLELSGNGSQTVFSSQQCHLVFVKKTMNCSYLCLEKKKIIFT